jgi:uncharacterized protein YodC (DUF2158 family)
MNVGDTVVLRSGGPQMTVREIKTVFRKKSIECVWFDKNKKLSATFGPDELETSRHQPAATSNS